ncbi:MAG: type I-E CRISPR-associated protein Cas6/Cse3/CasE [Alphaproteobacteria bacterium]|nr:MAG: type I-E CRISPR-associated protein Cas6/Cse3/CasE [Alphaproteobacteria bacterium]TAF75310.1 MAG: type I-E CRISPR-associated protein Cas6/Cse3/CasE [Alphaproteobacteria bacterium]
MIAEPIAYASVLQLSRHDVKTLKIHDAYALHKVVYGLFEDVRSKAQKNNSEGSGILYADKGGDAHMRQVLMLSNRKPHLTPQFGRVETKPIGASFVAYDHYAFEITINPTKRENQSRKIIPIKGREAVAEWFMQRASQSWGFDVVPTSLEVSSINVQSFKKDAAIVTHGGATVKGALKVTDRERFLRSFCNGIGRGRSFGFGLLQIVPHTSS